jgi:hypothetical protein
MTPDLATNIDGKPSPKRAKPLPARIIPTPRVKQIRKPAADNLNVTAPEGRSRVTNGKTVLLGGAMHKRTARRFRDILAAIVADLGGVGAITEGKKQLARRAALMSVTCEELETTSLAQGQPIDLDQYGMLSDRIGHCFQRLGLKRVSRNITPSIAEVAASFGADSHLTEAAKRQRKTLAPPTQATMEKAAAEAAGKVEAIAATHLAAWLKEPTSEPASQSTEPKP